MLETSNSGKDTLHRRESQGGFTLVELLIVIVILAILAAIVVFAVGTTSKNAVAASCSADAKSVETAEAAYDAQMAAFPTSVGALVNGTLSPSNQSVGPWLRAAPTTIHYNIVNDAAGDLFVLPPNEATAIGSTDSVAGAGGTTAAIVAGGAWDFDHNPNVCGLYS